jgi:hypothetical protein
MPPTLLEQDSKEAHVGEGLFFIHLLDGLHRFMTNALIGPPTHAVANVFYSITEQGVSWRQRLEIHPGII